MGKAEPETEADHLQNAMTRLEDSQTALTRLAKICCRPERSPAMNQSLELIERTVNTLGSESDTEAKVNEAVAAIAQLGAQVGPLYATCCTPKRAPHYRTFFEGLGDAHGQLASAVGAGHH